MTSIHIIPSPLESVVTLGRPFAQLSYTRYVTVAPGGNVPAGKAAASSAGVSQVLVDVMG